MGLSGEGGPPWSVIPSTWDENCRHPMTARRNAAESKMAARLLPITASSLKALNLPKSHLKSFKAKSLKLGPSALGRVGELMEALVLGKSLLKSIGTHLAAPPECQLLVQQCGDFPFPYSNTCPFSAVPSLKPLETKEVTWHNDLPTPQLTESAEPSFCFPECLAGIKPKTASTYLDSGSALAGGCWCQPP